MTLRARLTAAFLAVVLGPVLVGALFVGVTVTAVGHNRAEERLQYGAAALHTAVDSLCSRLSGAAETVGMLATESGTLDPVRSAEYAGRLVRRGLAEAVTVTDAGGTAVAEAGARVHTWTDCADTGTVTTGTGAGSVGAESVPAVAAHVALYDADGRAMGTVRAGVALDADLVDSLAALSGCDVTVLTGDGDPPLSSISPQAAAAVAEAARGLNPGEATDTEDGGLLQVVPAASGQPLELVLTTDKDLPSGLYPLLLLSVAAAGFAAVGVAWWLARSTTRPVTELATAADRVAAGDLEARVPVRGNDEVAHLANNFNRMTREMQGYVQALTASRDQLRGNLGLLGDTLSSTHDLDRILEVILSTAMTATGAQSGAILLVDEEADEAGTVLVARCHAGIAAGDPRAAGVIRVEVGEGLLGGIVAGGESRRGRVTGETVFAPQEPRCHTYIAVPFTGADGLVRVAGPAARPVGVLALYDRLGFDEFDDTDLSTLRTFAGQAAVAVENVLLHEEAQRLSLTDPLTGLWNYRYLKVTMDKEVERAHRFGRRTAVIAIDLDRFKDVNDTYGHPVGDQVLIELAARITAQIREVDFAFRYGGEEFVVLLPETDRYGAIPVARRLGEAIRRDPFPLPPTADGTARTVEVTISMGIAIFPDHGETGADVLAAADEALYAAKAAGRDTYRVSKTDADKPPGDATPVT
ncbi:diguanylate cyclase [Phytomonospora sp. NPDC050363]|uniref:diguanylate cyclase n=1 Tax=Phytomonospora sp. NPDC050363 TaxID=3155642 RepID=UPI003401856D